MSHNSLPLAVISTNQNQCIANCLVDDNIMVPQATISTNQSQCNAVLVHTVVQYQTLFTQTQEEDALIDTNQEAISYRAIYNHFLVLKEAQRSQLQRVALFNLPTQTQCSQLPTEVCRKRLSLKDLTPIRVTEAQQLKHRFTDGSQATLSQSNGETAERTASYFRGPFDLFTGSYCDCCYGRLCVCRTVDQSDGIYKS